MFKIQRECHVLLKTSKTYFNLRKNIHALENTNFEHLDDFLKKVNDSTTYTKQAKLFYRTKKNHDLKVTAKNI